MEKVLRAIRGATGGGAGEGGSGGNGGGGVVGLLSKGAAALGLLGWGISNSIFNVEGGHRAVMFNRVSGVSDKVYNEGTHFMLPWFDRPVIYDVRTRPRNINSLTGSKDLQMVNISLRVLYKPDIAHLPAIYTSLGMDYDERVLPSIGNEVLKAVVARFNASELLTRREQVSREIRNRLVERARDFHLILDDVSVTHIGFGKEYTAAVEAKQVAQQDAERARFIVQKALQDKKSTIVRAEGEARSAQLIGEALSKNPAFMELRKIEAAKDIATTISRSANRVYLSSDTLMLNLMQAVGVPEEVLKAAEGDDRSTAAALSEAIAEAQQSVVDADKKIRDIHQGVPLAAVQPSATLSSRPLDAPEEIAAVEEQQHLQEEERSQQLPFVSGLLGSSQPEQQEQDQEQQS